jgi:predicted DNA-binding transcriptional regulator YafY
MSKENKQNENLSLTGYRVMAILKMLKERPHSEAEINENFKNDIIVSRELSKDSIWLYINTLKALGCQISRPTKKNEYKYTLKEHPFKLNLTDQEIKALIEVRKYIATLSSWEISCNFDKFINTVCEFLDEENKKILLKHCKLASREIDYTLKMDLIKDIEYYCEENKGILIHYSSPSGQKKQITFICEELKYENGALYLWGSNAELEETQYLRVDRIESIKKANVESFRPTKQPAKAIYKLYGLHSISYQPADLEEIIDKDEKSITIQAPMKNKFKLVQKILSFGLDCEVLEPEELKYELYKKLRVMSQLYDED